MSTTSEETGRAAALPALVADGRGGGSARPWQARGAQLTVLMVAAYVVLQLIQLWVLRRSAPRFFWVGDSQTQFGPTMSWLGRHLEDGRPPLMNPEMGQASNLVADMQYGVMDPLHWLLQAVAGRTDDLLLMSWLFASTCVLLLGTGLLVLLRSHGVHPGLAVATALGAASSGFYLWFGSMWWPVMWSVAWLPWFWWSLSSRRVVGLVVLAVATAALLASGNPYVLFFPLALVLVQLVEIRRASGSWRGLLERTVLGRALALGAGLALALPTLASAVEMSGTMQRPGADALVGNQGWAIVNFIDVLLGSPTLLPAANYYGGGVLLIPATYTFLVALPALALVRWERAWRHPGVRSAGAVVLLALVLTQLPTAVAVFRNPIRYLVAVQIGVAVLAAVAVTVAPLVNRRRLLAAVAVVLAQGLLAVLRTPVFGLWHVLATALSLAVLAGLVVLLRGHVGSALRDGRRRAVAMVAAVAVLVGGGWGGLFLAEELMVSVGDRVDRLAGKTEQDRTYRRLGDWGRLQPGTVSAHREQSLVVDGSATALTYTFADDGGWSTGVLRGNLNLLSEFHSGLGSLAVWHRDLNRHWCMTYAGSTCGAPGQLLEVEPTTGMAWVDLLSQDTVLLHEQVPPQLREHFDRSWTAGPALGAYREYRREDGLPGRVTYADDVDVRQEVGGSRLAYSGQPMDVYTVSTGSDGGSLVLRIPYWPGLQASLDGQRLVSGTVDGAVLRLDLPAGVRDGTLSITYAPLGDRIMGASLAAGGLLLAAALALVAVTGRRRER